MFRKDGLSKEIALEYDLSYIMRKEGISFPANMIFFLRTENERSYFSKNTWNYDVFGITLHYDISGITEKDDTHLRKDDIGILCTFVETFSSVFIYCFPIKKPQ